MPSAYNRPTDLEEGSGFWQQWTPRQRLGIGLGLLVVLGALARFAALGVWSLWLDEALTLADAVHGHEVANPLGYWLTAVCYRLFGDRPSEALMRLPAALAGAATIGATAWAFQRAVGRLAGLAAAFFVAASSWHLYWSQNARFYTLTLLFVLIGVGWILKGFEAQRAKRMLLGFALLVLAPLVHPSAVLVVSALVAAFWIARWTGLLAVPREARRVWSVLSAVVLIGAFVGPVWVLQVLTTWDERQGDGSPLHFLKSTGYLLTPTLGLAAMYGAWVALSRRRGLAAVVALTACIGPLLALGLSAFVRVSAQYVFVFLPFAAATAAIPLPELLARAEGSAEAWGQLRHYRLAVAFLAVIALPGLVDSALYFGVRNGDRPHWREAYRFVMNEHEEGDLIFGMDAPVGEYYLDPRRTDLRNWRRVTWLDDFRARVPERWLRYPRRMWFILQPEQLYDWTQENRDALRALLSRDCRLVRSYPIGWTPRSLGLEVWVRDLERDATP